MLFAIEIRSAVSTLEILDRQARKDCAKIVQGSIWAYTVATCPAAMKRYRIAREVCGRLWEIAVLIAAYAVSELDRFVREHERVELPMAESSAEPEPAPVIEVEIVSQPVVEPVAEAETPVDFNKLNAEQLRKACAYYGIKWRKADNGRHLSKTQMVEALQNVLAV